MVLDQSVMNVSISTLVADFDTTVTTIQAVITLYCLVMAMFMRALPPDSGHGVVDYATSGSVATCCCS